MKYFFLNIFLLLFLTCYGQKDNFYKLYDGGDKYPKPIYYLVEDDFEVIKKIEEGGIVFISTKTRFIYNPKTHHFYSMNKQEVDKIKFVRPEQLFSLEAEEYGEKSELVKKENKFIPLPPINHSILKILILIKKKNCYYAYEVDWL